MWGIGLAASIAEHTTFLHDGRARSILEAVLWHGGEAAVARDRVKALGRTLGPTAASAKDCRPTREPPYL
ncbi:probable thiol oxidoreductase with 2 cytochrome c heme-binding sites [Methylocaldum marinum]|uniref:Probable thiol oxidoreductase with 2 cytochrome c heme-binding sites n=1 Tax=Methylocaldum marinum TaxID=1432792 RepID=A0A250KVM9_9GAMM|nr:di-heme oxidoredictase family protein [Methylocaldum marinum]BBA35041.1 probable thiol oxidoreductase with 2 cytochrome c heme-binding sites [Methylocaldum marinum]